jgi:hypothetical protein
LNLFHARGHRKYANDYRLTSLAADTDGKV